MANVTRMHVLSSADTAEDVDKFRYIKSLQGDNFLTHAAAKLNITLRVGDRESGTGLHRISSIMQTIALGDPIMLKITGGNGNPIVNGVQIENNIIERALKELSAEIKEKLPCEITLYTKNIPTGAGLGSGSSDAAAALRLANRAFGLNMSITKLDLVAERVGSDVSFLLRGGRALVEGATRPLVTPMVDRELHYLVVHPDVFLGTPEMYRLFDRERKRLRLFDYENDFTVLAFDRSPETRKALSFIRELGGSVESGVTGKGPTVFAGYNTADECEDAGRELVRGLGAEIHIHIARSVGRFID